MTATIILYIFLLAAEAADAAEAAEAADAADAAEALTAAPDFVTGPCWRLPLAIPLPASRGACTALAAALADAAGIAALAESALLAAAASTFAAGAGVCAMAVPIVIVATATVIMNLFIEFFILLPILKFECAVEYRYVCP